MAVFGPEGFSLVKVWVLQTAQFATVALHLIGKRSIRTPTSDRIRTAEAHPTQKNALRNAIDFLVSDCRYRLLS